MYFVYLYTNYYNFVCIVAAVFFLLSFQIALHTTVSSARDRGIFFVIFLFGEQNFNTFFYIKIKFHLLLLSDFQFISVTNFLLHFNSSVRKSIEFDQINGFHSRSINK